MSKMSIHYSSKSAEHNTPQKIVDAVVRVMKGIDLDPCSNAESLVNAKVKLELETDGLLVPWVGRVYMNPPYGRKIGYWIDKLRLEYDHALVTEAIVLVPSRTDTAWFDRLIAPSESNPLPPLICNVRGRLTFGGNTDPAPFPSAIVYLGDLHRLDFIRVFSQFGRIWTVIK